MNFFHHFRVLTWDHGHPPQISALITVDPHFFYIKVHRKIMMRKRLRKKVLEVKGEGRPRMANFAEKGDLSIFEDFIFQFNMGVSRMRSLIRLSTPIFHCKVNRKSVMRKRLAKNFRGQRSRSTYNRKCST